MNVFTVRAVATDCIVFVRIFFSVTTITHEPLHVARWNFARTCILTTSRTPLNFKIIGRGHFFVSWPKFTELLSLNVENIVVYNAVFACWLLDPFQRFSRSNFAIKLQSCPKSSTLLITHKPLQLAWCNFVRACTLTTSRSPCWISRSSVKGQGHMDFLVFFCVHDTAANSGQYLANKRQ